MTDAIDKAQKVNECEQSVTPTEFQQNGGAAASDYKECIQFYKERDESYTAAQLAELCQEIFDEGKKEYCKNKINQQIPTTSPPTPSASAPLPVNDDPVYRERRSEARAHARALGDEAKDELTPCEKSLKTNNERIEEINKRRNEIKQEISNISATQSTSAPSSAASSSADSAAPSAAPATPTTRIEQIDARLQQITKERQEVRSQVSQWVRIYNSSRDDNYVEANAAITKLNAKEDELKKEKTKLEEERKTTSPTAPAIASPAPNPAAASTPAPADAPPPAPSPTPTPTNTSNPRIDSLKNEDNTLQKELEELEKKKPEIERCAAEERKQIQAQQQNDTRTNIQRGSEVYAYPLIKKDTQPAPGVQSAQSPTPTPTPSPTVRQAPPASTNQEERWPGTGNIVFTTGANSEKETFNLITRKHGEVPILRMLKPADMPPNAPSEVFNRYLQALQEGKKVQLFSGAANAVKILKIFKALEEKVGEAKAKSIMYSQITIVEPYGDGNAGNIRNRLINPRNVLVGPDEGTGAGLAVAQGVRVPVRLRSEFPEIKDHIAASVLIFGVSADVTSTSTSATTSTTSAPTGDAARLADVRSQVSTWWTQRDNLEKQIDPLDDAEVDGRITPTDAEKLKQLRGRKNQLDLQIAGGTREIQTLSASVGNPGLKYSVVPGSISIVTRDSPPGAKTTVQMSFTTTKSTTRWIQEFPAGLDQAQVVSRITQEITNGRGFQGQGPQPDFQYPG